MTQPLFEPAVLSDRAKTLPGSPIRALLSGHRSGAELDLGGDWPDPPLFPSEEIAAVAGRVVARRADRALQYAPTEGIEPLRAFIVRRLALRGCSVSLDQVLLTHGSQQALSTVLLGTA